MTPTFEVLQTQTTCFVTLYNHMMNSSVPSAHIRIHVPHYQIIPARRHERIVRVYVCVVHGPGYDLVDYWFEIYRHGTHILLEKILILPSTRFRFKNIVNTRKTIWFFCWFCFKVQKILWILKKQSGFAVLEIVFKFVWKSGENLSPAITTTLVLQVVHVADHVTYYCGF